jgi:hypothetical protein
MHPSQHGYTKPKPKGINLKKNDIGKVFKRESELVPVPADNDTDIFDNY